MDNFLLKYPEVTFVTDMKHRLHRFPTFLSTCESFKSHAVIEDLRERKPLKSLIYFGGCESFTAKGGKSGAVFAKTKDKRFIVKEINKTEYESFALFGPKYFEYLSDPNKKTCLTKIFGMYEVMFLKLIAAYHVFFFGHIMLANIRR
ncbi:hypothetical protein ARALYDRAFT_918343 [Arabidopsis lyrata subsp. lyrata]|uniref:PIPK domain-containing protein n=1 Tax=Arabidopsis lyrata subsp. lyrata TaxID=81972 RepID=D7MSA0_ARALL|nr:hypothetical protein ARALYDRAFT_918343 [Arabidopsis lyrata subsp. lyrata]